MDKLAAVLATSNILREWRKRYRLVVEMCAKEFALHFTPIPPDTYDSVHEDIISGGLQEFQSELTESGLSVFIDFEHCSFGAAIFTLFVAPIEKRKE